MRATRRATDPKEMTHGKRLLDCVLSLGVGPGQVGRIRETWGPTLIAAGGKVLARGGTAKVFEAGIEQRTVLLEFESAERAIAAYDSEGYRAARAVLGNAAERDLRIVEGID